MSPEQVGRAIAAALKHPPLVENSDSADCSPKVYARGTAVVKTVCGMTPEQVGRTVAEATSELHAALEQVREAAGLTEGAARGLLSELGHKDLTADQLPGYLANAVAEYHQIVDRLNTLEGQDPKLERLRLEALSAVESGNLDHAQELLAQVRKHYHDSRAKVQAAGIKLQIGEARSIADEASLLSMKYEFVLAGNGYREAFEMLPPENNLVGIDWLSDSGKNFALGKDYAGAVLSLQQAISLQGLKTGHYDLRTAHAFLLLAFSFAGEGQILDAEQAIRRSIDIRTEAGLGQDGALMRDYFVLGGILAREGRNEDAETAFRKSLALNQQLLDSHDPEFDIGVKTMTLASLSMALTREKELAESEPLAREGIALAESLSEPERATLFALETLILALEKANKFAEAAPFALPSVAIVEKLDGPNGLQLARQLDQSGSILRRADQLEEAERQLKRAVGIYKSQPSADHADMASALENLAAVVRRTGRMDGAAQLIRQALQAKEAAFGSRDHRVREETIILIALLLDSGDYAGAEICARRAIALMEEDTKADDASLASMLNALGRALRSLKQPVEAEAYLRRALEIRESILSPDHVAIALSLHWLALTLRDLDNAAAAEPLLVRALDIYERRLGAESPTTRSVRTDLNALRLSMNRKTDTP